MTKDLIYIMSSKSLIGIITKRHYDTFSDFMKVIAFME